MEWKKGFGPGIFVLAVLLWTIGGPQVAWAQEWARKMFDHFSHDFGVLVRGQKAEHRFRFRNLYVEDVEIESVTSTCGCTVPEVSKRLLKTHEVGEIIARANTTQFLGRKEATIRVRFRKPFPAEVQLHCYMYIRSDVVFEPGLFNFGTVSAGKESPAISVTATHLARGDWQILEARAPKYMTVSVKELSRQLGRSSYQIVARLAPDAPVGYIRDNVLLITNDPDSRLRTLTVQVEAVVAAALTARPSPLMLGVLAPGQKVVRKLLVQGEVPFHITGVELPSEAFSVQVPEEAAQLQWLLVEFTAPSAPGRVSGVLRIQTDLDSATVEVPVAGHIVAGEIKPATNTQESAPSSGSTPAPKSSGSDSPSPPGRTTITDETG